MLVTLSIRDIVLIDRLDLDFAAGMSVLTGETGAGKSILLDALSLALWAPGGMRIWSVTARGRDRLTAVFDVELLRIRCARF
jgi:DNA repair protein RecN (Recombination protein N)